jgi:hypothetical protein
MALENEITNIVQLPAIVKSGNIKVMDPDLLKLDESDLKKMAMVMGGELVYMKVRATYTQLEKNTQFCAFKDCYRLAHDLWCDTHPNGQAKTEPRSNNVRNFPPMVNPRTSAS